jgi:DNA-binding Lrp family transcriptional regulator
MFERINYYESSQEPEYPTWRKGKKKREILLKLYKENPSLPLEQAAQMLEISKQQVQRHRRTLICEGLLKVGMFILVFASGAYYGLTQEEQTLDEWIESHIECPILELAEDVKWEFNL